MTDLVGECRPLEKMTGESFTVQNCSLWLTVFVTLLMCKMYVLYWFVDGEDYGQKNPVIWNDVRLSTVHRNVASANHITVITRVTGTLNWEQ